jgi:type III restriction enzyme
MARHFPSPSKIYRKNVTPPVRKYRPDFLVRLANGGTLVLETKGQDTEQDKVKRRYLEEWVDAVNSHGGFGNWRGVITLRPGEIRDIFMRSEFKA